MKNLYIVTLYNFRGNYYRRQAVTVPASQGATDAENQACEALPEGFTVRGCVYVCATPDEVFMEV